MVTRSMQFPTIHVSIYNKLYFSNYYLFKRLTVTYKFNQYQTNWSKTISKCRKKEEKGNKTAELNLKGFYDKLNTN